MYAIAINGSPRKGGNTEILLKEVLSELKRLIGKLSWCRSVALIFVAALPVGNVKKRRIINAHSTRTFSIRSLRNGAG